MLTGIPDLQADDSVRVGVDDALGHEAGADGGRDLGRVEGALAVPHDEGGLAHALGAEDDDLGLEGRHGSIARLFACLLACLLVWLLACLDCLVLPYRRVWLGSVGRACLRETYLVFGAGGG